MTRSLFIYFIGFNIIFALSDGYAQERRRGFGDVVNSDFIQTARDTSSAIILFNIGDVKIDNYTGTTYKHQIRYRILNKSAINEWGNFKLIINKRGFTKPRGITYNLEKDGIQQFELADNAIKRKKFNNEFDEIAVAFTNVKVGSIIEFQYTIRDKDLYFPTWRFQDEIPTVWSEFSVSAPRGDYVTHFRGSLKPSKYEEKYEGKYRYWLMKDVPAFNKENLMPDGDAYMSSVRFSTLFKSWKEICESIMTWGGFGGVFEYRNSLSDQVKSITAGMTDSIQMVKSIASYIKDRIQFNGVYDYLAWNPKELLEKRQGSSGDINLLYASMLKKAGFNVKLVLLSTRDNGLLFEGFTSLTQMNYVVCMVKVNQRLLYLDATERNLAFDILPQRCLNHKGFFVSQTEFGWVEIEPTQQDKIVVESDLNLMPNGLMKGRVKNTKMAYAAFNAREMFYKLGEEKYKQDLIQDHHWDISESKIQNVENLERPIIESLEISSTNYATVENDVIYINPHIFLREEFNPLTAEHRTYPIDFGMLTDHHVISHISIPDGYEIENIPENKVLLIPENNAKCIFSFTIKDNVITVMSRLQINKTWFSSDEYEDLREFYARLIARKSEVIVLKRKV